MSDFQASSGPKTGALPSETLLGGRYRIELPLGKGGMGAVYRAHDERLDIVCAIKQMSAALLQTDDERERARRAFHEEAKLLARLNHPNLPRVTDHFTEDGKEYLVMEFVPGETLAQVMRRQPPPWPISDVMALAEPLTEVLQYLHSQTPPIIFRDLKPANVMRTPQGQIKLIDFGIARLFKPGQSHDTQAFGTMGYSSPEQYGQGQTDARSDVYALGVLLHQLATAHDPISQPFNVPLAHRLNPRLPEQWSAVLQTAMSHAPEDRFGSMTALRRALLNAANPSVSQPFVAVPQQSAPMMQPQVGYAPPANVYQQPTPQQPYSQPYSQSYQQPIPPQSYGGPPMHQPVAYGMPPVYAAPPMYAGPPVARAKTSGVANVARWFGLISVAVVGAAFLVGSASWEFSAVLVFLGFFLACVTFILSLVGLNNQATKNSLKGRAHAGLALALALMTVVLACVFLALTAQYYG